MAAGQHMEDRDLLVQLREGSHVAFQTLYHRYKMRLAGNLLRMLKSPEWVEEVLQDLFMRLWSHREQIDPERPIKAYLFRVAENLVRDMFRRAARDQRMQQHLLQAMSEAYFHVEERLISQELKEELRMAIELLPPKRREVYVLCKLEAKSYEEVSQLLHISSGTVNDHIKKANLFLRRYLAQHSELGIALLITWLSADCQF
ncbi:DNA-directed RNA polymerase sigma-70 factor [Parapedobacter defluvii]|uniref:DNA-directed RNA polymerase sigma-70 factor n=1 Tax=Parapedobacter defluvii TaxID=2045106 RepID=A0ABQ1L0I8_9SPHI|nr:RNA polymerase sigma-70 factor [Parapedobacter defluvii]GGC17069.1 DNA-directed RNA polymerase sigma-70 factor [Parapedobacter defluvii]